MSPRKAAARRDTRHCCPQWKAFPAASKNWAWSVMHRFGHSRDPFTEAKASMMAQRDTEQTRDLITQAVAFGWIEIAIERPDGKHVYVGKLPPFSRTAS